MDAAPDDVVDTLLTSARALVGMAIQTVSEGPMPVTVAQHRVLLLLEETGGLSVTEVATRLGVDQSNASRHCTRLDELGLVDRRQAAVDRRSVELRLSSAGRRQVRTVREARRRWANAVLTRLASDEIGTLVAGLATFAAAADTVHPDSPAPLL